MRRQGKIEAEIALYYYWGALDGPRCPCYAARVWAFKMELQKEVGSMNMGIDKNCTNMQL